MIDRTCSLEHAHVEAECGGKASRLARMIQLGLSVPAGQVIPCAVFQRFLLDNHLSEAIATEVARVQVQHPDTARQAARAIRARILQSRLPEGLLDACTLDGSLVVRSSAIGEDSSEASFAGVHDSILHVQDRDALRKAILACWASFWSERALFYRLSRNLTPAGMAVIVQKQVDAVLSGVLFTRAPDGDGVLIEYTTGLADALVAGQITPGRVRLERNGKLLSHEASSEMGGSELTQKQFHELLDLGLRLEVEFRGPQDIEWCIDAVGQISLVQSRPITRRHTLAMPTQVFSSANVNENYPDPLTPFLQSIAVRGYYHYFRNIGLALGFSRQRIEAMEFPLRHLIGVHGGRMYYNLSHVHAVLRLAPFGEFLTQAFGTFTGAGATGSSSNLASPGVLGKTWEVAGILARAGGLFLFLDARVRAFEREVNSFALAHPLAALPGRSPLQLLAGLRGFMTIRCERWLNASLADAASMIGHGLLARWLGRHFPEESDRGLFHALLRGLRNLKSAGPIEALWELAGSLDEEQRHTFEQTPAPVLLDLIQTRPEFSRFRTRLEQYLDCWGFRRSGELLLTRPSYHEQPAGVLDLLRAYLHVEGPSPADRLREQEVERLRVTRQVLGRLPGPWSRFLFKRLLGWTQRAIALRERARHQQALLYDRCRQLALALGDHLVQAGYLDAREEVFFLTPEEAESLFTSNCLYPDMMREMVRQRRQAHENQFHYTFPEHLEVQGSMVQQQPTLRPEVSDTSVLVGKSACGGVAQGRAAVLHDLSEFERLAPGDLLVAPQTDPGWGPAFYLIRGLVLERGGMLSHGAILAREYGIPTVVGVAGATARIRHGQQITVHGDHGLVHLDPE